MRNPTKSSIQRFLPTFPQRSQATAWRGFIVLLRFLYKRDPYCEMTIAAVRVSGIVTEETKLVSGGKL